MLHITLWDNGEIICDQDCNGLVAAVVKRMQETPGVITHGSNVIVAGNKLACTLGYKSLRDHLPEELKDALHKRELMEALIGEEVDQMVAGAAVEKHEPPKKNGETDIKAALMELAELFEKLYGKE